MVLFAVQFSEMFSGACPQTKLEKLPSPAVSLFEKVFTFPEIPVAELKNESKMF